MTKKVQKIREEVARIQLYTQSEVLKQVLDYIDKVQEEPVSEQLEKVAELYTLDDSIKPWKNLTKEAFKAGAKWQIEQFEKNRLKACDEQTPEEAEREQEFVFGHVEKNNRIPTFNDAINYGVELQKKQDTIRANELEELINKLSAQFPEVSFAKLSRIAVRVAKWQKENLWKPADGDDLPEIDREVIAILDNGKVVFAHRPPEYWDGKNIITGKVTRNYPKTYDKGGWNIPDVKFWLDVELPKEIEL